VLAELPTLVQLFGGMLIVAGLVAVRTDEARQPEPEGGEQILTRPVPTP